METALFVPSEPARTTHLVQGEFGRGFGGRRVDLAEADHARSVIKQIAQRAVLAGGPNRIPMAWCISYWRPCRPPFTREAKMTFFELVRRRQSTREFLDRPVEREKIERCVEAAWLAPSACNF